MGSQMTTILNSYEIDFAQYMEETDHQQKVKPATVYIDQMIEELIHPPVDRSVLPPWSSMAETFAFRPGEVTVWAGHNGGGKSMMTGQVALSLIKQNQRVCIASFEMKPMITLARMVRQFSGKSLEFSSMGETAQSQKVKAYARFKEIGRAHV